MSEVLETSREVERADNLKKIYALEDEILKLPQVKFELKHEFVHGLYIRTMYIPAGHVLTGKVHNFECYNVVVKGRITVMSEQGLVTIDAPYCGPSPAGTKRAGYAHTDVEWKTFHSNPTEERDIEKLEAVLVNTDRIGYIPTEVLK